MRDLILVDDVLMRESARVEKSAIAEIIMRRKDNELIRVLNESYDFDVEQLAFVPCRGGGFKLFLKSPKFSFDIDDCGDGMRYSLYLLSMLADLKDTAVLLEEPETHQNLHALNLVFKSLLRTANMNNLQIMITTHSWDVTQILSKLAKENLRIYHLERERNGTVYCDTIHVSDAKELMHL